MALSVLFLRRLLLSIIRMPKVQDDEKDGTEHLSPGTLKKTIKKQNKNTQKNKNSVFCPLREARFCSRIELSAVSAAPRSASKIMGHAGGKVGWGKECKGFCWVCCREAGVPSTLRLGTNGNTSGSGNKSAHFYSFPQQSSSSRYLSRMSCCTRQHRIYKG